MGVFSSSGGSQTVVIQGASNPTITRLTVGLSPVEIQLPNGCRRFLLRSQGTRKMELAYSGGEPKLTIPPGCSYTESDLSLTNTTINLESPSDSIIELLTWI